MALPRGTFFILHFGLPRALRRIFTGSEEREVGSFTAPALLGLMGRADKSRLR